MLLIVADDLTGAADSAARCCGAGLPAVICAEPPDAWPARAEAVALTSDSRHLSPADAAGRVRGLFSHLPALPPDSICYKKIDSTLRGNVGAEIDALLDGLGMTRALVCPAFPAQGRTVEDGRLVLHGAPQDVYLPQLLAAQGRRPVAHVSLAQVRGDAAGALRAAFESGARLVTADALADADLDALCTAGLQAGVLLCGSAGLAGALARRLARETPCAAAPVPVARGPILAVVGSGSAVAHAQVAAAARAGVQVVTVGEACDSNIALHGRLILRLPPPEAGAMLDGAAARVHAARLADAAAAVIEAMQPARLVLVGGDTAGLVLARLDVRTLRVAAEVLPGMPLCRGQDAAGAEWEIALKAGSHGAHETLLELMAQGGPGDQDP